MVLRGPPCTLPYQQAKGDTLLAMNIRFVIALLGGLLIHPVSGQTPFPATQEGAAPPSQERDPGLYMIMNTSMGSITARLFEKEVPSTVANFVALSRGTKWAKDKSGAMVKRPYFTDLTFHRVIPGFLIQTGDAQKGDGTGDCGFTIKDEIVPALKFDRPGMLGLARLDARNTGACQFFITDAAYPSLNGAYTIFGQVVDGQDVVAKIARVPTGSNDKPRGVVALISTIIKRYGPPPAMATPTPSSAASLPAERAKSVASLRWSDDCVGCSHRIVTSTDGSSLFEKILVYAGHVTIDVGLSFHKTTALARILVLNESPRALDIFPSKTVLHIEPTARDIVATNPQKLINSVQKDAYGQEFLTRLYGVRTTATGTITDSDGTEHDVTLTTRDGEKTRRRIDEINREAESRSSAFLQDRTAYPWVPVAGWLQFETHAKQISAATIVMTIGDTRFEVPFVVDAKTHLAH
jgi:peptidyl-prolyl cis-trans isomerase A (cyclophilin A)